MKDEKHISLNRIFKQNRATILCLLGFDHTKLTYRYAGRDFRLTGVYGNVIQDLIV